MNRWNPCSRRDFIRRLRQLGFRGPYSGSRHQGMKFEGRTLPIPSNREYSVQQLRYVLRQAAEAMGRAISAEEWNSLD